VTAPATILPGYDRREDLQRWSLAAAIALLAHGALAVGYLLLPAPPPQGAPLSPAVIIELAPLPVAPASPVDLAPGPQMTESLPQRSSPAPVERQAAKPMPKLEAAAQVTLPLPAPKPVEAQPQQPPQISKPERAERKPPAPRTSATPRSERQTAPVARAPSPGSAASRAALANWRDLVVARLQRSKRYPASAEARGEQGVVTLRFSVDRHGRVLARQIARSSGHPALDQEVLAMIARAAPLPPFPPAMTHSVVHLSVPVRFSLR